MLDPSQFPSEAWRNGAGTTKELSVATQSNGLVEWRISLAAVCREAEFSSFPKMDRILVALGPLKLSVDGVETPLTARDQARFRGESSASVATGEPTQALNVMTRRGLWSAEVVLRDSAEPSHLGANASVLLGDMVADVYLSEGADADE